MIKPYQKKDDLDDKIEIYLIGSFKSMIFEY